MRAAAGTVEHEDSIEVTLASRREHVVDALRRTNVAQTPELRTALRQLMLAIPGAFAHATAAARAARRLGEALRLPKASTDAIERGALLHDVGKLVLPTEILRMPRPLTPEERRLVRRHPELGCEIARAVPGLEDVADIVLASHEWFDGRGYPRGLAGEAIPLASRFVAVADAFDVMTQRGTYSSPVSSERALEELHRGAGTQFDPVIVAAARLVFEEDAGDAAVPFPLLPSQRPS
jgi:putative nucleotidyltransferase with HDIG domain